MSLFLNLLKQEHYKNTKNIVYNMLDNNILTKNAIQNNKVFILKNTTTMFPVCDQDAQYIFYMPHACLKKDNTDNVINYKEYTQLFENNIIKLKIMFENEEYNDKLKKLILTLFRLIENKSQAKLCGLICKTDEEYINLLNPFRIINILKLKQPFLKNRQEITLYAFYAKEVVEDPYKKYEHHSTYLNILKNYLNSFEKEATTVTIDKYLYDSTYEIYEETDDYPYYNLKIIVPKGIDLIQIRNQECNNQPTINKLFFADTITDNIIYPYSSIILFETIAKGYAAIHIGYSHGNISPYTNHVCYGTHDRFLDNIKHFTCVNAQSAYVGPINITKEPLLWLFRDKESTRTILKNYLLMKFQTVL